VGHPRCKDLEGFILIGVFGRHVPQHNVHCYLLILWKVGVFKMLALLLKKLL